MRKIIMLLLAVGFCAVAGSGEAKKAPHIEKEVTGPEIYIRPEIQDLGTTSIHVSKLIFRDNLKPDNTTLTLDLLMNYKPTIQGTAVFYTENEFDKTSRTVTIPVTGKTKSKKQKIITPKGKSKVVVPGFTLKGATVADGTTISLSLSALQTTFTKADTNTTEALSSASYEFTININGLGEKYKYVANAGVKGRFHFGYELAPDDAAPGSKPNLKSDYYYIYAPYESGLTLAKGKFQIIDGNGLFTLTGPKMKLQAWDFGYSAPFVSEEIKLKTAVGKFQGDPYQY